MFKAHFFPFLSYCKASNYWGLFPNHECHSFIFFLPSSSSFYTNFSFENDLFSLKERANFLLEFLAKLWLIGFAKLERHRGLKIRKNHGHNCMPKSMFFEIFWTEPPRRRKEKNVNFSHSYTHNLLYVYCVLSFDF